MTLIKSISGIRGTIGGLPGDTLSPLDIVKFTSAFGQWVKTTTDNRKIVVGRDARPSGNMLNQLVCGTLIGLGFEVIDFGLSTTPTVEIGVTNEMAGGGIILTASHNPVDWNALKLLNQKGEFLSAAAGEEILNLAETPIEYPPVSQLGSYKKIDNYIDIHIQEILSLPEVDVEAIANRGFKVAVDAVNSTGGIAVPKLLKALGVDHVEQLYCEPHGRFPHNPEPLPEHLTHISSLVVEKNLDLGIVVDPDVDRLALVCEDGSMFGEEYTLVAVADYILSLKSGNTVSNLSSTRALRDITELMGGQYYAAAVGEVNVVDKMKDVDAIIGGEGNGGVIYPAYHYGRDALLGIALFLTHLAKSNLTTLQLRLKFPDYHISKNKIELTPDIDVDNILLQMKDKYQGYPVDTTDGVKIEFDKEWVHLRKSNTEPIIRIYAESESTASADELATRIIADIKALNV